MKEKRIHEMFVVSVARQGLHALVEIAGGVALYLVSTATINLINRLMSDERLETRRIGSPGTAKFAQSFSLESSTSTLSICSATACMKLALVVGLLREKLWAYPASFAVFGAFIAYQLYRYSFTHDLGLVAAQHLRRCS